MPVYMNKMRKDQSRLLRSFQILTLYFHCPRSWFLISFHSSTNFERILFAVAGETSQSRRTSEFIINVCYFRCSSIFLQRISLLSKPLLILIASMSDALMAESMNSINSVDSPAEFETLISIIAFAHLANFFLTVFIIAKYNAEICFLFWLDLS